jgi:molybdate transport system substrate-binding protein
MRTLLALLAASLTMSAQAQEPIKLYAAGSLRSALSEVAAAYTDNRVDAVYGPSGLLRDRIAKGERPEVFASANMEHPHSLTRQGLAGPVKRFARNRLCGLAAPKLEVSTASLLQRMLEPGVTLGTSTPKADPSGDYAWQLFEKAERVRAGSFRILSGKALKLTGGPDSPPPPKGRNQYGALVAEGRADVFLTYCTNALEAKNENPALQVVQVPEELSVAAEYGLALVHGAREQAFDFSQFILSPKGQAILVKYGFSPGDSK